MASPYLAEIRLMSFNHPPKGWARCDGQTLPINQNQALFSLLGTTFGGNGQTTFALPDLRDRVPMHAGNSHTLGERGGQHAHTLTLAEVPSHTHVLNAAASGGSSTANPAGAVLGAVNNQYRTSGTLTTLNPGSLAPVGGSQAHENRQPYLPMNYCIALQGIFPSQN